MLKFLNQLQISMSEVIFRSRHALAKAWREGRAAQTRYRGAALVSILTTLGFGATLHWIFRDTATFSLYSKPSFALWFGSWFLVAWIMFASYVMLIAVLIELISWVRR